MDEHDKLIICVNSLRAIRDARDHHADHGEYPKGLLEPDQCFDDWAADEASLALQSVGYDKD